MIIKAIVLPIIPILLLQACAPASHLTNTPSVPILQTAEFTPAPTKTVTPAPTQTVTATNTRTVTPTPTITLTPLPSLTYLPTLPNPREALVEFYGTNGGCKLPCWWGITPGTTSIEEVRNYFLQFRGEVNMEENEDQSRVTMYFPPANTSIDYAVSSQLLLNDHIIQAIKLDYETVMWGGFFPGRMIAEYGKPDEIYFTSENENTAYLAFYYSTKHIFVEYPLSIDEDGNNKKACFQFFGSLITWHAEMPAINQFTQGRYSINSGEDLLQTDMTTFYEVLIAKPTSFCFLYEDSK